MLPSTTVALPFYDTNGTHRGLEAIPARPLAGGRHELAASPGLVEGVAAGDIVEVIEERPGFRMISRGGNLCVWLIAGPDELVSEASVDVALVREIIVFGGHLDGGAKGHWVFTVPLAAGWDRVEACFDRAVERVAGRSWFYGNVYDPTDGKTPLGWWEESG